MSPDNRVHRIPSSGTIQAAGGLYKPHSIQFSAKRRIFDKGWYNSNLNLFLIYSL